MSTFIKRLPRVEAEQFDGTFESAQRIVGMISKRRKIADLRFTPYPGINPDTAWPYPGLVVQLFRYGDIANPQISHPDPNVLEIHKGYWVLMNEGSEVQALSDKDFQKEWELDFTETVEHTIQVDPDMLARLHQHMEES